MSPVKLQSGPMCDSRPVVFCVSFPELFSKEPLWLFDHSEDLNYFYCEQQSCESESRRFSLIFLWRVFKQVIIHKTCIKFTLKCTEGLFFITWRYRSWYYWFESPLFYHKCKSESPLPLNLMFFCIIAAVIIAVFSYYNSPFSGQIWCLHFKKGYPICGVLCGVFPSCLFLLSVSVLERLTESLVMMTRHKDSKKNLSQCCISGPTSCDRKKGKKLWRKSAGGF